MKKEIAVQENHGSRRKKLIIAVMWLLVSSILLTTVSYAWLIMSVAPEVTGITTNIGANGSLEMALLTTATYNDPSLIKNAVGMTLQASHEANKSWGNLVDVSHQSYGLSNALLLPARLNLTETENGYTVDLSSILNVPNYAYDGRIISVSSNTMTGGYHEGSGSFIFHKAGDYGVRAIGTSNLVNSQSSALSSAKSNIASAAGNVASLAGAAMKNNGSDLIGLVMKKVADSTYSDTDVAVLVKTLNNLEEAVNAIDRALRQGVIAYAASKIEDPSTFDQVKSAVNNTGEEIQVILDRFSEIANIDLPSTFETWLNALNDLKSKVRNAKSACANLTGNSYTWDQLKTILDCVMALDNVYIGEQKFSNMSREDLLGLMSSSAVTMTLTQGSGLFADIAKFCDDYATEMTLTGTVITVNVMAPAQQDGYLVTLHNNVKDLNAAGSDGGDIDNTALDAVYGYVLDLAFRCNAPFSDLLLQTDAINRVFDKDGASGTMGGGSYMEFSLNSGTVSLSNTLKLMDAVRVAFIDNAGSVLGIAKLNTSNRIANEHSMFAPLYLYDFSISTDVENNGALIMGERRLGDNAIKTLLQNQAEAISVVVWLDGDLVDNTMVSAESETSLSGTLNLQFASSADLVPATSGDLQFLSADINDLVALVERHADLYKGGQGAYSTVSWDQFVAAYDHAAKVVEEEVPSASTIYRAGVALANAFKLLNQADMTALQGKIDEIRKIMGTTDEIAGCVIIDENGDYVLADPYTMDQEGASKHNIMRVNYDKNILDKYGNDVVVRHYSDESWANLASALYQAEFVVATHDNLSYEEIDPIISALDTAYKALEREVYFTPYDLEGELYYLATYPASENETQDNNDSYGKWYDCDFKRVVSDLTILKLDSYAKEADVATIWGDTYINIDTKDIFTLHAELLTSKYPQLADEVIFAIMWNELEGLEKLASASQINALAQLIDEAKLLGADAAAIAVAETFYNSLTKGDNPTKATYENVKTAIDALAAKVAEAEAIKAENDALYMSADLREVLTKAVNVANAVTYDSILANLKAEAEEGATGLEADAQAKFDALQTPKNAANELLGLTATPTSETANACLAALNTALNDCGVGSVTAANTILHSVGPDVVVEVAQTVDNWVEYRFLPDDNTPRIIEVSATILTQNGILLHVKDEVKVYVPAAGATILDKNDTEYADTITVIAGNKETLKPDLFYSDEIIAKYGEDFTKEEIASATWSSANTSIFRVFDLAGNDAEISAVSAGTATLTCSVTTVEGNTYIATVIVNVMVNEAPQA